MAGAFRYFSWISIQPVSYTHLDFCNGLLPRWQFNHDPDPRYYHLDALQGTYTITTREVCTELTQAEMCIRDSFWGLSIDAKLLYAIFLDRVSLSIKNGWVDENGRVFIYYSCLLYTSRCV